MYLYPTFSSWDLSGFSTSECELWVSGTHPGWEQLPGWARLRCSQQHHQ